MDDLIDDFIYACWGDDLKGVDSFLSIPGFDPNASGDNQWNGLQNACCSGAKLVVAKLLSLPNTDLGVRTTVGSTLLHLACEAEDIDIVKLLLQHPLIDIDACDNYGETSLFNTAKAGHIGIMKVLILAGADIGKKNKKGNNILTGRSNFGVMKLILDNASPSLTYDLMTCVDDNQETTFSIDILKLSDASVKYLLIKLTLAAKQLGLEVNLGNARHSLFEEYRANPEIIWLWQEEKKMV